MTQTNPKQETEAVFSAILSPHRSLSKRGFLIVMGLISGISFGVGTWFYLLGAWPVLGFFGLDVLLIYLAFKANYRSGRMYETVVLTPDNLIVTRTPVSGEREEWSFHPVWVKLNIIERLGQSSLMELSSHGRKLIFGSFLTDDERTEFAAHLEGHLGQLKRVGLHDQ